jgi:hypothetical protein
MKCVLHIGTEKTATTTLQDWLYANQSALRDCGVALSDMLGKTNNRHLPAYFQEAFDDFFLDKGIRDLRQKEAYFTGFEDRFRKEVDRRRESCGVFVISSEHFQSRLTSVAGITRLRDFLLGIFSEVRVICYLREQSEVRRSLYSTAIITGSAEDPQAFFAHVSADDPYYNYALLLDKWAGVFGRGCIEAVLFDPDAWEGRDIRRDLIRRAAPGIDTAGLNFGLVDSNRSLSYWQCLFGRAVNQAMPRYDAQGKFSMKRAELVHFIVNSPALAFGEMVNPHAAQTYALFDASNRAFGQRYLGTAGNPFRPPQERAAAPAPGADDSDAVSQRISAFFVQFARQFLETRLLTAQDVAPLRDIALHHDTGQPVSLDEALYLLAKAQRISPGDKLTRETHAAFLARRTEAG